MDRVESIQRCLTIKRMDKAKGTGSPEETTRRPVAWKRPSPIGFGLGPLGSGKARARRGESFGDRHSRHPGVQVLPVGKQDVDGVTRAKLARRLESGLCFSKGPVLGVRNSMNQQRTSQRIPMELPVEIRWKSRAGGTKQAIGKTGNISGSGLFIEVPIRLHRATSVSIKVMIPREATQTPLELLCKGRVVRWNRRGQVQGLGAVIDEYELRPMPRSEPGEQAPPPKQISRPPGRPKISPKKPSL